MKAAGYALITLGFLAGAYVSVARLEGIAVEPFLLALAVGVVGVVAARFAARREARHEDVLTANIDTIEASLARLAEDAETLDREKGEIDVYELRHRIDATFPADLDAFVEARESIAHSYGLQAYADVMNEFAAGERYLRRVWSASTDGYVDEAHDYLTKAKDQFAQALATFRGLRGGGSP